MPQMLTRIARRHAVLGLDPRATCRPIARTCACRWRCATATRCSRHKRRTACRIPARAAWRRARAHPASPPQRPDRRWRAKSPALPRPSIDRRGKRRTFRRLAARLIRSRARAPRSATRAASSFVNVARMNRIAVYTSETNPPPCRSKRPASSSSNSTRRTTRGDDLASRTRSSTWTGAGLNSADDPRALVGGGIDVVQAVAVRRLRLPRGQRHPHDRLQHGDDIGGLGHRRRALLDQAVGAFRARIERRARHGKHFAALFERQPRRDQRARAFGRLDDDDAEREPGNQAIAPRKIPRAGLPAERHFGDRDAGRQNLVEQVAVFRRIDSILAAGKHRDRSIAKAGAMRRRIDAARQTGNDGKAGLAQAPREIVASASCRPPTHCASRRWPPPASQARGRCPRTAMQRRRIVDHLQALRIVGLADGDERDVELSRGVRSHARPRRANKSAARAAAATARQRGQRLERRAGAAEMIDQGAKRARPDILAADQPQPVDALLVGQANALRRASLTYAPR